METAAAAAPTKKTAEEAPRPTVTTTKKMDVEDVDKNKVTSGVWTYSQTRIEPRLSGTSGLSGN
jgi:hypothetical protein